MTVSLFLQAAYPWTKTATVLENQQQGRHDNQVEHVVHPQILAVNSVYRMTVEHFQQLCQHCSLKHLNPV